ncbi:hypothetical protein CDD82_4152 [Ophiocordyceps australis]|uniref:Uncharacterized protein n=1 Tax=Ophiocordyceps australis TaxID=1399860 RepID=A0A2C5Z9I2_9HYPO|nr:hypothetical protein CDD82_4152 [Ophiocordyceps australis]
MRRPGNPLWPLAFVLVVCLAFSHALPVFGLPQALALIAPKPTKARVPLRRLPSDLTPLLPPPTASASGPMAPLKNMFKDKAPAKAPLGPQGKFKTTGPMGRSYSIDPATVPAKALGHNPPGAAPLANSNYKTLGNKNPKVKTWAEKKASSYLNNPNLPKGNGQGTFTKDAMQSPRKTAGIDMAGIDDERTMG